MRFSAASRPRGAASLSFARPAQIDDVAHSPLFLAKGVDRDDLRRSRRLAGFFRRLGGFRAGALGAGLAGDGLAGAEGVRLKAPPGGAGALVAASAGRFVAGAARA